ncbi:metallophosphoesterase [Candidatus Woesearchaeota archaeon]|nr:metallophosphoesterase [Candidatus Woesearchaeota archaeon]
MKIFGNIELVDLAVYTNRTLIVSDFHIGYEEALNKQGILMPRFQFKEVIERLGNIFRKLKGRKIDKIVILGDLKHEFGTISEQEWRHTLRLLDYLGQRCKEIILIKGNHDTILGPIAQKRNVKVQDYYVVEPIKNDKQMPIIMKTNSKNKSKIANITSKALKKLKVTKKAGKKIKNHNKILCLHGDKMPSKELLEGISTIIIGHEHPAVSIKDGPRAELFKCFLVGKWKGKNLIVVPAFNLVTEGTDILRNCYAISGTQKIPKEFSSVMKEKLLSPFLKSNLRNFKVIVVEDRLYWFGKIGDLS